jgi:hypothetical protein
MRKTCDDRHPPPRRARRHEFVRLRALWPGREGRANKARTPQEPGPGFVPDSDIAKGERRRHSCRMTKLCIFAGTTAGGYAGWAIGEVLGLGFGWAFVLSGVGSIAGVYAGWKLARKLET